MSNHLNTEQLVKEYPALFTVSMLKKSRMKHSNTEGPPSFNIGRKVIYSHSDVLEWIASQKNNVRKAPLFSPPRRAGPGRPTKEAQIERRASAA